MLRAIIVPLLEEAIPLLTRLIVISVVIDHPELIHLVFFIASSHVPQVRVEGRAAFSEDVFVQGIIILSTFLV